MGSGRQQKALPGGGEPLTSPARPTRGRSLSSAVANCAAVPETAIELHTLHVLLARRPEAAQFPSVSTVNVKSRTFIEHFSPLKKMKPEACVRKASRRAARLRPPSETPEAVAW